MAVNITQEQLDEYLTRMNQYFETSFYELFQNVDKKTNDMTCEFTPKKNEQIVRLVALENKNAFPIQKDDKEQKIGLVTYKKSESLCNTN